MITSAQVNLAVFAARSFDSGSLTQMLSVVHQFERPGRYVAVVRRNGVAVGQTEFEVSDQSDELQLDIDLARVRSVTGRSGDCRCEEEPGTIDIPVVSSKGYVLFTVLSGYGGFSVLVGERGAQGKPAFDSESLEKGDLFALTLLEPARYSLANRHGSARGEIEVSFKPEDAKRIRALDVVHVGASKDRFDPAQIAVTSTQGLVFRINDVARIVIERHPAAKTDEPVKARRNVQYRGAATVRK